MNKKIFWMSAISGTIGGLFGAVSGANSLFVVGIVGGTMGFLTVWLISGFFE